jgi:ABC-type multidrug transport system ATPase subunit
MIPSLSYRERNCYNTHSVNYNQGGLLNMQYQELKTDKRSALKLPFVQLQNVGVRFKKIEALKDIKLEIRQGEMLFVTGASGAGKSTLLRVLSGEVEPTSGEVIFPNKEKYFTAPIFQDLKLIEKRTVEENLMTSYDSRLYQSKEEFYKELTEIAKFLGAWEFFDLPIKNANGGLKQKTAIMRALLSKPKLILADEPTSALDRHSAYRVYELLSFYNSKKGITIVWTSHNRELVREFAGRIVHLDQGKLVFAGQACFT